MKRVVGLIILFVALSLSCIQESRPKVKKAIIESPAAIPADAVASEGLILTVNEKKEILIHDPNSYSVAGNLEEKEALQKVFTEILSKKRDKSVFIRSAKSIENELLADLFDILLDSGAKRPLGLEVVEPETR